MIGLGLNAYHADSSAAIFRDGVMVAATEEERFRRIKHWAGFPSLAIAFCLQEMGATLEDVDFIAIGRDPRAKLLNKFLFLLRDPFAGWENVVQRFRNRSKVVSLEDEFFSHFKADRNQVKQKIKFIEHHRSHMASAFFPSPFEEAAILSIDGSGDFTTTMIGKGKGNKIDVFDSVDFPVSCGIFYTAFTQFLGFPHYGDEYKVMGLAPYGEPKYFDEIKAIFSFNKDGLFTWDKRYFSSPRKVVVTYDEQHVPVVAPLFSPHLQSRFGPSRKPGEELTQYHKDLAASVQKVAEYLILNLLRVLQKRTGLHNVCIAGGVAQNSVANGKVIGETGFKNLYVPSAGHDAGLSMGSALYYYHHILNHPRTDPVFSAYTGTRFSNDDIENLLKQMGLPYTRYSDGELFDRVVQKLIQPGVVGWFSGRAEFGPRALGARSILADPRNARAKDLLNLKIKRRESFRPFAPSILEEHVKSFFEKDEPAPFMERVLPIRKEKQSLIPAVTHVDGTGRLQTVNKDVSPKYYQLIDTFFRRTGVPILLNTSFNENEPIVNTPKEAIDCYLRTQMDMLVMENIVLERT